ncbi:MFS transporter [Clostridium polynesiense]|uniref:MFS transporter n=1 Tax=Clostridium polynesiense TaxID=1325933 RepID=UPI00058FFF1C|nr:MFS transporter [Clostridium polynesiense]
MRGVKPKNIIRNIKGIRKNYSKNALLYLLSILFFYVSLGAFSMLQGIYLKELGIEDSLLGMILSFKTAAMALASIPCAIIADRIGKKKAIIISMLFVPICTIFQGISTNIVVLLLLSVFQGVMNSFLVVSEGPFFMENSNNKNRIQLFSYSFAVNVFSTMVGYTLFGSVSESMIPMFGDILSLRYSMVAAGIIGLAACLSALFIKEKT